MERDTSRTTASHKKPKTSASALATTPSSAADAQGRTQAPDAVPAEFSIASALRERELRGAPERHARALAAHQRHARARSLRCLAVRSVHDVHDPRSKLSALRRRSKVVEISTAADLTFVLTLSGVCTVFMSVPVPRLVGHINACDDEVIRSLYFNQASAAIITVSVFGADDFSSLRCRSIPLEHVRQNRPELGSRIFEDAPLTYPGFVEFDDVNSKVLTYSAEQRSYSVWDMSSYERLFSVSDDGVHEVKISPDLLLIIMARRDGFVPLRLVCIHDGRPLKAFNQPLHRTKKLDLIEQFHEKLLIKQEHECLQIVDILTWALIRVPSTEFLAPSAVIFLHEKMLFLTFRSRHMTVWNFRGEVVAHFDDHVLMQPDTNSIFITASQDYAISYCREREPHGMRAGGAIHVSHILSGKCVAKVAGGANLPELHEVTALAYNEERCELYVGQRDGVMSRFTLTGPSRESWSANVVETRAK